MPRTGPCQVVLFTGDLRVHDHPPLHAAAQEAGQVVPLFVRDPAVDAAGFGSPNRLAFLADALADLDAALRERGSALTVRSGGTVAEVCRVVRECGAQAVHLAAGPSGFAQRRERELREALAGLRCELRVHDAVVTAAVPGEPAPSGKDHFSVFTPYFRQWQQVPLRTPLAAPRRLPAPEDSPAVKGEHLPARPKAADLSPNLPTGGESEARRRMGAWLRGGVDRYEELHDALADDGTSRLSPYLHFGCLSPVEAVHAARKHGGPGAAAFERQLAWRDFNYQLLSARPETGHADYRPRQDRWRSDRREFEAWCAGETGYPIVDAAMRQLAAEGWMHNRGRLLTASLLTKTLYHDWRAGARHFLRLLLDGDMANNQLNWQWVAGTGTDTRPNRVLNPTLQGRRYDPEGAYVRRWVPELAEVPANRIHEPWRLTPADRKQLAPDYPDPIVDLADGLARFRAARA